MVGWVVYIGFVNATPVGIILGIDAVEEWFKGYAPARLVLEAHGYHEVDRLLVAEQSIKFEGKSPTKSLDTHAFR